MKNLKILMGENLVWNAPVRVGSHHLARLFLQNGNNVFWVSLPWSLFHIVKGPKYERIVQWNKGKVDTWQNGLKTYCPLTLLPFRNNIFFRNEFAARNTLKFSFPGFRKILETCDFSRVDVLWLTDPRFIALKDVVEYDRLIYRCVDDLTSFANVSPKTMELEKEIVKEADIVFATAGPLVERLKTWRKEIHYLPNAVDLVNFQRQNYIEPGEIKHIPHPRVIYTGTIGPWFDVTIIHEAATVLKDVHFILVGPIKRNCSILKNLKNVHLLGPKKFESIPDFLKYSDAAVIPFAGGELSDAVNPLKLYEYFSLGLPVVSTNIQEVANMNSPAILCEAPRSFVTGIKKALKAGKNRDEYLEFAGDNSWQSRYEIIETLAGSL